MGRKAGEKRQVAVFCCVRRGIIRHVDLHVSFSELPALHTLQSHSGGGPSLFSRFVCTGREGRTETNDETLFKIAAKRVCDELSGFDVRLLAELAHTHAEIGIKNEGLFKTISVKILAKQKDLKEDVMGRAIKAYARFMIPLTEEKQGFRTMAVVQKGDFIS